MYRLFYILILTDVSVPGGWTLKYSTESRNPMKKRRNFKVYHEFEKDSSIFTYNFYFTLLYVCVCSFTSVFSCSFDFIWFAFKWNCNSSLTNPFIYKSLLNYGSLKLKSTHSYILLKLINSIERERMAFNGIFFTYRHCSSNEYLHDNNWWKPIFFRQINVKVIS